MGADCAGEPRERPLNARRGPLSSVVVWAIWVVAVLALVVGFAVADWFADPQHWARHGGPLWPLFTWDYGWYAFIAQQGYPHGDSPVYAFYPLWPLVLRASGPIPDWLGAFAVVVVATAIAFAAIAAATPSGRGRRAAIALACWPGSFLLLLGYPDALALAAAACAALLGLRGYPLAAGPVAGIAAIARPNGVLIALPLALATRAGLAGRAFAAGVPVVIAVGVQLFFWNRSGNPRAFFHAQALPIWQRSGPTRFQKWPGHLVDAWHSHAGLLVVGGLIAAAVIYAIWRWVGGWWAASIAYVFVVGALLLGAQFPQTRIQSAIAAAVVPVTALLWRFGGAYRPWALFATAVVAVSALSGSVTSFSRQVLFAFPLYWAVADGPRTIRHPLIAAIAIAANVAYLLTLTKFTP